MPKLLDLTREQRRRKFIEAAWRCLSRQGYRDLTVDEICAEAGLSKGAFYAHYESKEALLLVLIADDAASIAQVAEEPETLRVPSVQRIRNLTETMLIQGTDPARVQLRSDVWGAVPTNPAVREAVTSAVAGRQAVLRAWVKEAAAGGELALDVPPNAVAALLVAISDGLILHYALDPYAFRWRKISKAVDRVVKAFAAPPMQPRLRVL